MQITHTCTHYRYIPNNRRSISYSYYKPLWGTDCDLILRKLSCASCKFSIHTNVCVCGTTKIILSFKHNRSIWPLSCTGVNKEALQLRTIYKKPYFNYKNLYQVVQVTVLLPVVYGTFMYYGTFYGGVCYGTFLWWWCFMKYKCGIHKQIHSVAIPRPCDDYTNSKGNLAI